MKTQKQLAGRYARQAARAARQVRQLAEAQRTPAQVEVVRTKVVHNLMTGKPVVIDVDTPRSCDPSTELYWSM